MAWMEPLKRLLREHGGAPVSRKGGHEKWRIGSTMIIFPNHPRGAERLRHIVENQVRRAVYLEQDRRSSNA